MDGLTASMLVGELTKIPYAEIRKRVEILNIMGVGITCIETNQNGTGHKMIIGIGTFITEIRKPFNPETESGTIRTGIMRARISP